MSRTSNRMGWAIGGTVFAATMMVILGILHGLLGIAAIAGDTFIRAVGDEYTYDVDLDAWGWIHLIAGAAVFLAGLAVFTGAVWARAVGVVLAVIAAIASFLFIPYYPIWATLLIGLSVFSIWALTRPWGEPGAGEQAYARGAAAYRGAEERWPAGAGAGPGGGGYTGAVPGGGGYTGAGPGGGMGGYEPSHAGYPESGGQQQGGPMPGGQGPAGTAMPGGRAGQAPQDRPRRR